MWSLCNFLQIQPKWFCLDHVPLLRTDPQETWHRLPKEAVHLVLVRVIVCLLYVQHTVQLVVCEDIHTFTTRHRAENNGAWRAEQRTMHLNTHTHPLFFYLDGNEMAPSHPDIGTSSMFSTVCYVCVKYRNVHDTAYMHRNKDSITTHPLLCHWGPVFLTLQT